jgi:prephenate dehydrogenase
MKYGKVSILGMGLIGGGIGIDLKKRGLASEVCAWGRSEERLSKAQELGACDKYTLDIAEAVNGSEIIILATPPDVVLGQMTGIKQYLKEGMLVMDVASIKGVIVEAAEKEGLKETGAEFIACHPMAGSEKTGALNAYPDMFQEAPCILPPGSFNTDEGIQKAKTFWEDLGSNVINIDPEEHDLFIGFLSHLPHIISSVLVKSSSEKLKDLDMASRLCGPSFKEMTRISVSSPELWRQIYVNNSKQVINAIDSFSKTLDEFRKILKKADSEKIEDFLRKSGEYKKKI